MDGVDDSISVNTLSHTPFWTYHHRVSFRRKKKEEKGAAAPVKEDKVGLALLRNAARACEFHFFVAQQF